MKGKNLLSYEMIVKAANGDPGATEVVLEHYAGYIRYDFTEMYESGKSIRFTACLIL